MSFLDVLAEKRKQILRAANIIAAVIAILFVFLLFIFHANMAVKMTDDATGKEGIKNFQDHWNIAAERVDAFLNKNKDKDRRAYGVK